MTPQALRHLVAAGESERLEFKKTTAELNAAFESLCAFLNGRGGRVCVGVSEAGKIVGQDVSDATLRDIITFVSRLEPHTPTYGLDLTRRALLAILKYPAPYSRVTRTQHPETT